MAQQIINVGTTANDGTGEPLRSAFEAVNSNFTEIYAAGPVGSNVVISGNVITVTGVNNNLVLAGNGVGNIQANSSIVPSVDQVYNVGAADSAFAEVHAGYYYGNGFYLTGISGGGGSGTSISNGTSNVSVVSSGGNVTVGIQTQSNVVVFGRQNTTFRGNLLPASNVIYDIGSPTQAWNDLYLSGSTIYLDSSTISANATAIVLENAAGGRFVLDGTGDFSQEAIFNGLSKVYIPAANGNVQINVGFSPNVVTVHSGGMAVVGTVSATGNIEGNYIIGNGSQLTGLPDNYSNANVASYLTVYNGLLSGQWANLSANVRAGTYIEAPLLSASGNVQANVVNTASLSVSGTVLSPLNVSGNVSAPNFNTVGIVDATTLSASGNLISWNVNTGNVSLSGNVISNINTTSNVRAQAVFASDRLSATGNIYASGFYFGDGGFLGNITAFANVNATQLGNGSTILSVPFQNAPIISIVDGVANVFLAESDKLSTSVDFSAVGNITTDADVILTAANSQISAQGNTIFDSAGSINITGTDLVNIYYASANTESNVAVEANNAYLYTNNIDGNASTYLRVYGNAVAIQDNGNGGNLNVASDVSVAGDVTANNVSANTATIPALITNDIRSDDSSFVNIEDGLRVENDTEVTGQVSVLGNVTGANFNTPGILRIDNDTTLTSQSFLVGAGQTATVGSDSQNVVLTANVSGDQKIWSFDTAGNLSAPGNISAAANVIAPYVHGTVNLSATANVVAGNVISQGIASVAGNIIGNNVNFQTSATGGAISVSGNIQSGNLSTTNISAAGNVLTAMRLSQGLSAVGDISTVGNVLTQGQMSALGNVVTSSYFIGNFQGNITGNLTVPGSNTQVLYNNDGNAGAAASFTYQADANLLTVLGNISAQGNVQFGNILTAGLISATGNLTAGNVITGGELIATDNVSGANINTAGSVSAVANVVANNVNATANVTSGNITTTGLVSATGNVTGGNINTAGLVVAAGNVDGLNLLASETVSAVGNITGANLATAGLITATGNVTGGNINTAGVVTATGNITGDYFIGNGRFLTGIDTTLISNGTTEVRTLQDANVTVTVAGFSNVAVFDPGGVTIAGNVDATNAILTGEVAANTIATPELRVNRILSDDSAQVTFDDGIIVETTAEVLGNITGANVISVGNISALGNISAVGDIYGATVTATGNIDGGANINLTTDLSAGGNILVDGFVSALGNVSGENIVANELLIGNNISANNLEVLYLVTNHIKSDDSTFVTVQDGLIVENDIEAAGYISAAGNITGGNIDTAGLVTAAGNITGANIITAGNVSATGNVSGDYFIGNGRFLSGIDTTLISNGTTEVRTLQDANVTVTVAGVSNVAVFDTGGVTIAGNVNANNFVTAGPSGNITGANVISATTFTASANVIGGNLVTAGLVTATGNVIGGNILTSGIVSATGNLVGSNVIVSADVSGKDLSLTGNAVIAGNLLVDGNVTYINITDLNVQDPVILMGRGPNNTPLTSDDGKDRGMALWYYDGSEKLAFIGYNNSGTANIVLATEVSIANDVVTAVNLGTVDVGNLFVATNIYGLSANITEDLTANSGNINTISAISVDATGNITTTSSVVASLDVYARDWIGPGGNLTTGLITASGDLSLLGNVLDDGRFDQNIIALGNVTANTFIGDGSQLTGLTPFKIFNGNSEANIGNLNGSFNVAINAIPDILVATQFGVDVTGNISATGNVIGDNLSTAGLLSVDQTATLGNVETAGLVSAQGNVTAGNVLTAGLMSATGNVSGGNVIATNAVLATTLSGTGNVTGGNIITAGYVTAIGNVFASQIVSAPNVTGTTLSASGAVIGATLSATGNVLSAGRVSAAGNVSGGNIDTAGQITSTGNITSAGNITGGNILTGGSMSAAGAITATANVDGGNINSSARISGANLAVSATVSAAGNITGGNIVSNGIISAAGNIDGGNIRSAAEISTSGSVIGGVVDSTGTMSAAGNITSATNVIAPNFIGNVTGNINLPGSNSQVLFNNNGVLGATSGLVFDQSSNVLTVGANVVAGNIATTGTSGNITGANVILAATLSATANVQAGNLRTSGLVSATGSITSAANVIAGNVNAAALLTGTRVSVTGNVDSGNVNTSGRISVTGNLITGANVFASGYAQVTGNITGGNVLTAGLVSATGNITGGNINTDGVYSTTVLSAVGNVTGGNVNSDGVVTAVGNITSSANVVGDWLEASTGVYGNVFTALIDSDASTQITVVPDVNFLASIDVDTDVIAGQLLQSPRLLVNQMNTVAGSIITVEPDMQVLGNLIVDGDVTADSLTANSLNIGGAQVATVDDAVALAIALG